MGDFKINEKTVFTQSGGGEPAMGSTITGIPAAGITGTIPSGVSLASATFPAGHVLQVKHFKGTGSQGTTSSDVAIAEARWTSSTYPNIQVTSGNYIFVILEWKFGIYGGSNDSQGSFRIYDVTNTTDRGQSNNAYTAHTGNESSGIWNFLGTSTTCIALWTDSSGASVQISGRMSATSGGTCTFDGDYSHMTIMEVVA